MSFGHVELFFCGNLVTLQLQRCRRGLQNKDEGNDVSIWGQTAIHFPFYNYSEGASQVGISITRKFDAPMKTIASHPFPASCIPPRQRTYPKTAVV
jgi:hypothetical protein